MLCLTIRERGWGCVKFKDVTTLKIKFMVFWVWYYVTWSSFETLVPFYHRIWCNTHKTVILMFNTLRILNLMCFSLLVMQCLWDLRWLMECQCVSCSILPPRILWVSRGVREQVLMPQKERERELTYLMMWSVVKIMWHGW